MKAIRSTSLARNKKLLDDALATLIKGRYFETMPADSLRQVLRKGVLLQVPKGTRLIEEGGLDDDLYFLLSGELNVLSGGKLILRLSSPGDVAGEFAVVSSAPRSADVVADAASKLVRVTSSTVNDSEANPELATQFLTLFAHIMAAKLRETSGRAKLYEDAVLEAREIASSHEKLEGDIQDKLAEITLYSKVIETSGDAVVITDMDGVVQRVNPAAERMLPVVRRTRKKTPAAIHFPAVLKGFDMADFPAQPPGAAWRGEWAKPAEEGEYVLQVTASPIPERDGGLAGIAYQLRDISLQKQQEHAIELKNEQIQKALVDLESTYEELQRSDRLKTETLTVVSDELAAPVRKILTFTEQLDTEFARMDDRTAHENLAAIREQSTYIKSISENITQLIDVQQEFQGLSMDDMELGDLLREIQQEAVASLARRNQSIELHLPKQPLKIMGDRKQLKLVLQLLVEQALGVAHPRSTVKVTGAAANGMEQVRLQIDYQGPSFATVRPKAANGGGRFGIMIGLPLARKVISRNQGSLQFLGDGKAGRIHLTLPLAQREGAERANRIIIADEQEVDHMILQGVIEYLWPDSIVYTTNDPFEFLDNYEDFQPDLTIMDPDLSHSAWGSHRLVATLVANRRHVCPILALSGLYRDHAERTLAAERGVTDFLAKPYSIFDLRFKIKSLLQSHRKEESLHRNMDRAQRQAQTDGLTRLANRKHFDTFLEAQLEYSRQTGKACSLVILDIDNFKHYNDTHGHQMGDEVLKHVARLLAKSVRASDLAARYGGEEFALVLPETQKEMGAVIAEKVRRALAESKVAHAEEQPLGVLSASFGVSTYGEDGDAPEQLIKAADECLYIAKDRGRNIVITSEPGKKPPKKRGGARARPSV